MANTVNAVSYLACMYNWNNCSLATSKRSVKNKITQKIKWNQHNFFPSVLDSGDDFFLPFIIFMVNLFICLWMFNFYFSRHQEWWCWNVQLQTFHAFMWAFGRYLYIGACPGGVQVTGIKNGAAASRSYFRIVMSISAGLTPFLQPRPI